MSSNTFFYNWTWPEWVKRTRHYPTHDLWNIYIYIYISSNSVDDMSRFVNGTISILLMIYIYILEGQQELQIFPVQPLAEEAYQQPVSYCMISGLHLAVVLATSSSLCYPIRHDRRHICMQCSHTEHRPQYRRQTHIHVQTLQPVNRWSLSALFLLILLCYDEFLRRSTTHLSVTVLLVNINYNERWSPTSCFCWSNNVLAIMGRTATTQYISVPSALVPSIGS